MAKITFDNKVTLDPQPSIARENKVIDDDINEIKSVVNSNAGMCDYSTNEINTGKTWIDGKTIYRKYLTVPHNTTGGLEYTHNLNIETVTSCEAFCTVNNQTISSHGFRPMPYIASNENYFRIDRIRTNSIITIAGTFTNNVAYIILEYTKNN